MKKIKWILLLGIICFGGYYLVFQTDLLTVKAILYNQSEELDIYELQRYSDIHYGDAYWKINLKKAREGLLKHPFVKEVVVNRNFPDQVIFNLTYKTHYFNLKYSDIILSLDRDLDVLKVLEDEGDGYTVEGFMFKGFSTGKKIDVNQEYVLENIVDLIELMNQSDFNYYKMIHYGDNDIKIKVGNITVKFGNGENIERRFNAFASIYKALLDESITEGVIDVSTDGLPVYKPFGE